MVTMEHKDSLAIKYLLTGMVLHLIAQGTRCTVKYPSLLSDITSKNGKPNSQCTITCCSNSSPSTGTTTVSLRRSHAEWGIGTRQWQLFWLISREIISHKSLVTPPTRERSTVVLTKHGCCLIPPCKLIPISLLHYFALPPWLLSL